MSSPSAAAIDLVVDFRVPASVASRYRARLLSVSRSQAQIVFLFPPSLFRSIANQPCMAEISLVLGRSVVRACGLCRMDGGSGGTGARIRFNEPIALHDYALLRRICGPETAASETPAADLELEAAPQTA